MASKKQSAKKKIGPIKEGAERKELHLDPNKPMPTGLNEKIVNKKVGDSITVNGKSVKITSTLMKRARFAVNMHK